MAMRPEIEAFVKEHDNDPEACKKFFLKKFKELGWFERVQNLYCIRNKAGRFVQFIPNTPQLNFLKTKSNRDVILKIRQAGFTTLACIYALDRALFDNWRTGIMAHKKETVTLIFNIVKDAYQFFDRDWNKFFDFQPEQNNTNRLSWSNTKSSIQVAYDFQGLTLDFLHVSEAAFVPADRLTNSFQAVPDDGEIVMESTPNGRGGFFYESYASFKKEGPNAPWKGFFVPWFLHYPEKPEKFQPNGSPNWSAEEIALKNEHNLQDYHLIWRRYAIQAKCGGDSERFDNQYPTDDVSCFLSGESNVYSKSCLVYQERFVQPPTHVGYLRLNNKKVELLSDKTGALRIWNLPKAGRCYAMGADPSGGNGKDPGCAVLFDYESGEQAAELHGFFDPDCFADEIYKLGQFYNQAFICIEANNHGNAVILKLKPLYFNLYRRQEFDNVIKKISTKIGFMTNQQNKITITDNLGAALREGRVKVRSDALLSELSTFVNVMRKANDGRYIQTNQRIALPGEHDDRVMAAALGWEMIRSRPVSLEREYNPMDHVAVDHDTGFVIPNFAPDNDFVL